MHIWVPYSLALSITRVRFWCVQEGDLGNARGHSACRSFPSRYSLHLVSITLEHWLIAGSNWPTSSLSPQTNSTHHCFMPTIEESGIDPSALTASPQGRISNKHFKPLVLWPDLPSYLLNSCLCSMFNLAFASFNNSINIILSSSVSVILRHFLIIDSSRHQESFSYSGLDLQALKKQFFFLQDWRWKLWWSCVFRPPSLSSCVLLASVQLKTNLFCFWEMVGTGEIFYLLLPF